MENIIILILLGTMLLIGYFVFGINFKKIKKVGKNERLDKIVERFPENKKICEAILKKLNHTKVKIKESDDNTASLYLAITDTILIANIKDNYTRIQTISHECLHSIQSRKLLLFNFIYSNVYLFYFILTIILTICGVFKDTKLQIMILSMLGFFYYVIRAYLETDAMTKARYVAKEYMLEYIEKKTVCKKEEVESVIAEYDRINQLGIPATNFILMANCIVKIIIYIVVVMLLRAF